MYLGIINQKEHLIIRLSHVVVAKVGDKIKTIQFGQQGVSGAGKNPKFASGKAMDSSLEGAAYLAANIH